VKFDQFQRHAVMSTSMEPSYSLLAAEFGAELASVVPEAQRRGFYLAVGRRMAGAETLDGVDDAAALGWRVNAFWQAIGWGDAEVSLDRDAILVRHGNPPPVPEGTPADIWTNMIITVLEGAYDSWFRRLGSGPSLHTSAEWKGNTVELRHGR
jgi:hypothetical protein